MRKNQFVLLTLLVALSVSNTNVLAEEQMHPMPNPAVQEEQKLMVTIRLEMAEDGAVHTENQEGLALYPQTVITVLSPMLVLGARTTVIYQNQMIPAIQVNSDPRLGLATLSLIKPLPVDTQKTRFFSESDFGENMFMLTSLSIIDMKNLTDDGEKNHLRGAIVVDDYGMLMGIVSRIEKDALGAVTPQVIPYDLVRMFIHYLEQGPPIPQFNPPDDLRPGEGPGKSVNLRATYFFKSRNIGTALFI